MVQRLELKSKRRQSVKAAEYDGNRLVSTGHVVEFACIGQACRHRFHVIDNPPLHFELLYGAEFAEKTK